MYWKMSYIYFGFQVEPPIYGTLDPTFVNFMAPGIILRFVLDLDRNKKWDKSYIYLSSATKNIANLLMCNTFVYFI